MGLLLEALSVLVKSIKQCAKRPQIGNCREICDLPKGGEGLLELASIQLLVAIEVHSLEDHLEGPEANTSLLLDSKLKSKVQLSNHNVLVHTVEGHRESKFVLYLLTKLTDLKFPTIYKL